MHAHYFPITPLHQTFHFVRWFPHPLYSIHILSLKIVINHFKHNNPFKNGFYRQKGAPFRAAIAISRCARLPQPGFAGVHAKDAGARRGLSPAEQANSTQWVRPGCRMSP